MTKTYLTTVLAGMVSFKQKFDTELDAENDAQNKSKSMTFAMLQENDSDLPIVIYVNGVAYCQPRIDEP